MRELHALLSAFDRATFGAINGYVTSALGLDNAAGDFAPLVVASLYRWDGLATSARW
jgi:hypothetical protein